MAPSAGGTDDRIHRAAGWRPAPSRRDMLLGAGAVAVAGVLGHAHPAFGKQPQPLPAPGAPNPPGSVVMNHVGLTVSDRARSQDFYVNALGFTYVGSLQPDNDATGQLLQVDDPNLTARYLQCGSFILELLDFDAKKPGKKNKRDFVDYGLTHLSFTVPDIPATLDLVRAYGGTVVEETAIVRPIGGQDMIVAIVVLDPDGQRIELLRFYTGPPQGPVPPL